MKIESLHRQVADLHTDRFCLVFVERPEGMTVPAWREFISETRAGTIAVLEERAQIDDQAKEDEAT